MASEQNISTPSAKPPDYNRIVNVVKSLAAAPVDKQHGRGALQTLLELNDEVDLMVANPLSSEMQRDICIIALQYPGLG